MYSKVLESSQFLKDKIGTVPKVGIILGSGLGDLVDFVENKTEISYEEIPNFPVSTVAGHEGKLIFGKIGETDVLVMKGRFHFYEGYAMRQVTYPVYVMKMLGVEKIIVTNAAGGANPTFEPGTLMIINDHINHFGTNPLIGSNDERFGPRFPDLSEAYSKEFIAAAHKEAKELGIKVEEGVYLGTTGPSYETAAEIRFFSRVGADAVGMSTVPEVIVANYLGMKVLGISCITNMATGLAKTAHSHEEVVRIAKITGEKFCKWVSNIVKNI